MTYAKFKENVLSKEYTDKAGLKKFTLRTGIFTVVTAFILALFVASIVNVVLGVCTILLSFAMFFMLLDYAQQDAETFKAVERYTKFWWTCFPIALLLFSILYLFNFI